MRKVASLDDLRKVANGARVVDKDGVAVRLPEPPPKPAAPPPPAKADPMDAVAQALVRLTETVMTLAARDQASGERMTHLLGAIHVAIARPAPAPSVVLPAAAPLGWTVTPLRGEDGRIKFITIKPMKGTP